MSNSKLTHSLKFEKTLESNDYGLIIAEDGALKGIWVPDHLWSAPLPCSIVKICIEHYGINPNNCGDQTLPQKLH
jgi:hypothetical protein